MAFGDLDTRLGSLFEELALDTHILASKKLQVWDDVS